MACQDGTQMQRRDRRDRQNCIVEHLQLEGSQVRAEEADAKVAKPREMGQHVLEGEAALDEGQATLVALDCGNGSTAQAVQRCMNAQFAAAISSSAPRAPAQHQTAVCCLMAPHPQAHALPSACRAETDMLSCAERLRTCHKARAGLRHHSGPVGEGQLSANAIGACEIQHCRARVGCCIEGCLQGGRKLTKQIDPPPTAAFSTELEQSTGSMETVEQYDGQLAQCLKLAGSSRCLQGPCRCQ